jgi:cysteinyl-tRNA synthetase
MANDRLRERLRLHNTLTRETGAFEPIEPGHVRMYHCGPTVYGYAHIGNMSAFLLGDLLRRVFEHAGYRVTQVMNITDVGHLTHDDVADAGGEDKLEAAARRAGRTPWDLARHYTTAFFQDLEALDILAAHYYPRATEFVPEMVRMIERLVERGYAYEAGGNVYFDLQRYAGEHEGYGRLSGNALESLEAGARIEVREDKRSPHDFALWKVDPDHIMQWDSPWGRGFPGWHIECSAMSMRFLGESFDVHTGGEDNIFPHHECEIAQAEGATGKPFVRWWLHTRFLLVEGKKMSKSLGNFFTLRDLLDRGWTGREVRYALLSTHYRSQPNFTFDLLKASRKALSRLDNFRARVSGIAAGDGAAGAAGGDAAAAPAMVTAARERFTDAIADDLNVSGALAAVFELVREGNKAELDRTAARAVLAFLAEVEAVLGIGGPAGDGGGAETGGVSGAGAESTGAEAALDRAAAEQLLAARVEARAAKDWARADAIRDELSAGGWTVEDLPEGARLKREL